MKQLFAKWAARFRQPKWRHGRLSALLMVAFMAACVLLNIAVETLENEYGWRRDMSFNAYATTTEETQKVLDTLTRDVDMYLLYQNGEPDETLLQLLNRYPVLSDRIRVLPTDIVRNPGVLTRFTGDATTSVQADSVVVHCPETEVYKILTNEDFITWGYDIEAGDFAIEGLAYEKELTEAIVYVTQDEIPTMGILQGHGELEESALTALTDFMHSNNYHTQTVNLRTGGTLEGVDLLLIAGAQNDLLADELSAITAFLEGGGSLFVMRDFTDPLTSMPNYLALLRSYGIIPLNGVVVAGAQDTDSYYGEQLYLLPFMEQLDLTLPLITGGMDVLLMPAASAFETPSEGDTSLSVATVLKTGPNAYLRDITDGNTAIDQQEGDRTGELSLAVYARRMHANTAISRVFAVGGSLMFTDEYIYQSSYVEEFLLQLLGELLPQKAVSLSIMAASAFRPALKAGSQVLGVALLVALPLCILLVAVVVLLPRRNR